MEPNFYLTLLDAVNKVMDERGIRHYTAGLRQNGDKLMLEIVCSPRNILEHLNIEIKVMAND